MTKTIHTAGQVALSGALARARIEAGLTQTALAITLRCHQSMVARVESGQRRIDVVELVILCRAIGVTPADIVDAVEPEVPEEAGL